MRQAPSSVVVGCRSLTRSPKGSTVDRLVWSIPVGAAVGMHHVDAHLGVVGKPYAADAAFERVAELAQELGADFLDLVEGEAAVAVQKVDEPRRGLPNR